MFDYISVTQIKMYLRCPAQYYFRYVLGLKIPPAGALVLGRAVHAGLEHYFAGKLHTGEGPPVNRVLDVFDAAFEAERPEADWGEDDPGRAKDDGAALTLQLRWWQIFMRCQKLLFGRQSSGSGKSLLKTALKKLQEKSCLFY